MVVMTSSLPPPPSFHPPTSAAEAAPVVVPADVAGLFIDTCVIVEDLVKSTKSQDKAPRPPAVAPQRSLTGRSCSKLRATIA